MRSHRHSVVSPVEPRVVPREELELRGRIRAEYVEMPGLQLTLLQASRLFGADEGRCAGALGALARDGFLARRGNVYVRAR